MTRNDLETWSRQIWSEAFALDERHTLEITAAVTGGEVFCWTCLTCEQLKALSRGLFSTARLNGAD